MWLVAAAPHLFDDVLNASPELALVDLDLAARLRAEIRDGEAFRPREVARPQFRLLLPDVDSGEVVAGLPPVEAGAERSADTVRVEEIVVDVEPAVVDVEPVVIALERLGAAPEIDALTGLPDYVVVREQAADEVDVGTTVSGITSDPPAVIDGAELPDYVVRVDSDLAEIVPKVVWPAGHEPTDSDYPILPDLGEASEVLEETDAALRKIREQLVSEVSPRRRRVRRRFTVASGLAAVAALTVFAVDIQLDVAALPGWLSL